MSGLNLLGANQWQTLQMQETTRPVAQPPVRPHDADPRVLPSQQPGVQTPVETGRAAHMETMQDHVDLSLRDGLSEHETKHIFELNYRLQYLIHEQIDMIILYYLIHCFLMFH